MNQPASETKGSASIIGAGNLAWHLAQNLFRKGYNVQEIFSRNFQKASELAKRINSNPVSSLKEINPESDFYFICVSDDAVETVSNEIPQTNGLVLHTSGSIEMSVLNKHRNYGVFYPVQTFSKNLALLDFFDIPLCLEASSEVNLKSLKSLAETLSENIWKIDSEQRKTLHLSAVFASNFPNYLFNISEKLLKEKQLDLSLLFPLIEETVKKIRTVTPSKAQTGSAIRKDQKTIEKHLDLLKDHKDFLEIYRLLTLNIMRK